MGTSYFAKICFAWYSWIFIFPLYLFINYRAH